MDIDFVGAFELYYGWLVEFSRINVAEDLVIMPYNLRDTINPMVNCVIVKHDPYHTGERHIQALQVFVLEIFPELII